MVSSGIMANAKNKRIADRAIRQTLEIKSESETLRELNVKVKCDLGYQVKIRETQVLER